MTDEIFGPVLSVLRVSSWDEAIGIFIECIFLFLYNLFIVICVY